MHEEVRVAISFRFTGVALEGLENVSKLSKLIKRRTDGVFCSLDCEAEFKEKGMNADAIYQYCLEKFSNCNVVVAFIAHEQ
jgi:hypothetical protein